MANSIVQRDKQIIKGITLHRPWSAAIAFFGKNIENRSWAAPIPKGCYLAIHAGNTWDDTANSIITNLGTLPKIPDFDWETEYLEQYRDLSKGSIIAVAQFGGNLTDSPSPCFTGPIGWKLENVQIIDPVACRGQQGLWDLPEHVLTQVRANFKSARI